MNKKQLGSLLLILSVLVWPVGWWILPVFGIDLPTVPHLLTAHLVGVIPGVMLRGSKIVASLRQKS